MKEVTVAATIVDRFRRFAAEGGDTAFFFGEVHVKFDLIELSLAHDRALFGFLVERIAYFQLRRFVDEAIDEIFVRRSFDKYPRTAEANLTLVRERRPHAAGDGSIKIGVSENDVWIFSAQLERNSLEKRRTSFSDFLSGHCAASKRDRIDLRMRRNRSADIRSGAVDDIEHALRQTGLLCDLAEQIRRHRRQLARLGDCGVTDCDGGGDFPAQQIE